MRLLLALYPVIGFAVSLSLASSQLLNSQPSVGLLLPGNFTLPTNDSLAVAAKPPDYDCIGGADYGDTIPLRSCRQAQNNLLEHLDLNHGRIIRFKDRRGIGGAGNADVALPYMSLSPDGLCAIEIISDIDYIFDTATIGNFRRWAQAMITTCSINSEEVKGGLARNLGKLGNLGLILTKFNPQNVRCAGLARPSLKDCESLLYRMPAADFWQEFGSRDDPQVEVPLPRVITDGNCRITVTTDGPPDQEKWYAIWKLSTAIVKLCVSASGRPGVAYGLGLHYNMIDIEVT